MTYRASRALIMLIVGMVILLTLLIVCESFCDFECRCRKACEKEGWGYGGSSELGDLCSCYHGSLVIIGVQPEEGWECGQEFVWVELGLVVLIFISLRLWYKERLLDETDGVRLTIVEIGMVLVAFSFLLLFLPTFGLYDLMYGAIGFLILSVTGVILVVLGSSGRH